MKRSMTLAALSALMLSLPALGMAGEQKDNKPKTQAAQHESHQPVDDTWITTKVKADLLASSNVPGTEVKVDTVSGVVSLSGTVATQAEKDKAIKVARGIKGVKNVDAAGLKVTTR